MDGQYNQVFVNDESVETNTIPPSYIISESTVNQSLEAPPSYRSAVCNSSSRNVIKIFNPIKYAWFRLKFRISRKLENCKVYRFFQLGFFLALAIAGLGCSILIFSGILACKNCWITCQVPNVTKILDYRSQEKDFGLSSAEPCKYSTDRDYLIGPQYPTIKKISDTQYSLGICGMIFGCAATAIWCLIAFLKVTKKLRRKCFCFFFLTALATFISALCVADTSSHRYMVNWNTAVFKLANNSKVTAFIIGPTIVLAGASFVAIMAVVLFPMWQYCCPGSYNVLLEEEDNSTTTSSTSSVTARESPFLQNGISNMATRTSTPVTQGSETVAAISDCDSVSISVLQRSEIAVQRQVEMQHFQACRTMPPPAYPGL